MTSGSRAWRKRIRSSFTSTTYIWFLSALRRWLKLNLWRLLNISKLSLIRIRSCFT
jgi:hypothetical protein